jgi:hypothetical protein
MCCKIRCDEESEFFLQNLLETKQGLGKESGKGMELLKIKLSRGDMT